MNIVGALIFLAGLVALVKPRLLRLPNRWWAAGVTVLGMVIVGLGTDSGESGGRAEDSE